MLPQVCILYVTLYVATSLYIRVLVNIWCAKNFVSCMQS